MKKENNKKNRTLVFKTGVLLFIFWIIMPLFPLFAPVGGGFRPLLNADSGKVCLNERGENTKKTSKNRLGEREERTCKREDGEEVQTVLSVIEMPPLLSSFTTYFDEANVPRCRNIQLCVQKISRRTLKAGEEFSFNKVVGKRTQEGGFLNAPVIVEGKFVSGVGGGICQVSTTLYNAALLAGLQISEVHAHSLRVGYAPPSLDATVSEWCDLKIRNPFPFPVALIARFLKDAVRVEIYGRDRGITYETESVTLEVLPPKKAVAEGEEDALVRKGKEGVKSESYLYAYKRGKLLFKRRIRQDEYAAVDEIRQKRRGRNGLEGDNGG